MATPFAVTLALAVTGVLDMTSDEGKTICKHSIAKLHDKPFHCTGEDLHLFLDLLSDRAREMGWDDPTVGIC